MLKNQQRTPDVLQWYNTVATLYPPALLLQLLNKCAHFAFSSHLLCTVLALTNAVQLPIPQLHISVVLLLTVFDSVLCQTNATKLCYLFCDPYCTIFYHMSISQECTGVNGEALQVHVVDKILSFLLQVRIRYYKLYALRLDMQKWENKIIIAIVPKKNHSFLAVGIVSLVHL